MFSPEALDDMLEHGRVSSNTLESLTHAVGSASNSVNPYIKRRDSTLQQQAKQDSIVNVSMFGHATPGRGVSSHFGPLQNMVDRIKEQSRQKKEPRMNMFEQIK